jgi:CheY-like chemotaxis protein
MKLLIVDDDQHQRKLIIDAIDIFNSIKDNTIITYEEADKLSLAIEKLSKSSFDGALIDLKLGNDDTNAEGNQVIKEIKNYMRFPIIVLSGYLGDLDPEFQIPNNCYKLVNRGDDDYENLLIWFDKIFRTGITSILNNKGKIQSNITNVFWKHISEILPEFINQKGKTPNWDVEKVLLRYISSHILEYLEISIDNNLEPVHNIEFYIKPPVKERIFTGDIIKFNDDNSFGIILTPACDLATDTKRINPKAEFVTVAKIQSYELITQGKNSGDIKKLCSNSMDLKFHYLPKTILFQGGFVNFQHILSIPINEFENKEKLEVECVITNPFRKDIIARFANYYSRQGQPAFE